MALSLNKIHWKLIEFHFDSLYKYATFFEGNLQQEQESVVESYESAIKDIDLTEEYYDVMQDSYMEDYQMIASDFTQNFRSFLLAQICSTVEIELVNLCKRVHALRRPTRKLPDFKSGGVFEKAKDFLEDVSKVDFSIISNEWNFLLMMRVVRNGIIHTDSIIEPPKPSDKHYTEKNAIYSALVAFSQNESLLTLEGDAEDPDKSKVSVSDYSLNILFLDKTKEIFNKVLPQINFSKVI